MGTKDGEAAPGNLPHDTTICTGNSSNFLRKPRRMWSSCWMGADGGAAV